MSRQQQLNLYIGHLQQRLRAFATVRGAAVITAVALLSTLLLTLLLNSYAFPEHGLKPARLALIAAIAAAAAFGLALPFSKLNRRRSIDQAESRFPELEHRLVTFSERQQAGDPFIELLAADTLTLAHDAPPATLVPPARLLAFAAAAVVCIGVLLWTITAAPGFMGYGASLLWTGPKKNVAPLYEIRVTPGDAAVRRNSDELVTAQVIGLDTRKVTLHARFGNASTWDPVDMQPQEGHQGFQFIFAALPQSVEYYVEAGPVQSKHFKFRVVDLPSVKSLQVTYHYPHWTGLQTISEEHGGDLSALEGTDAELTVVMDSPLRDGLLLLDSGQQVHLTGGEGNRYHGTIQMEKDGAYHVAATDQGQQVRLSEDYFISTNKANPPQIAIDRPGSDYRASPIEEVTIGVKAGADFPLQHVSLHYSVNGGPAQSIDVLKQPGAKDINGSATLRLEDYKLVPGDVISLYATAKDAHAEAHTEMSFIQVDPFEREFSQSQQSGGGGGGGGGGGQGNQTDISRREKELIAATWKQQNDKVSTPQHSAEIGKTLSEAQSTLRDQVLALSGRMQSRDLSTANEEFTGFEKDMQAAAAAMVPSASKLKQLAWPDAIPEEQKALQALLRAEATFRQIQVAFGQQGGGGGGGGGSAGRDLASLFDLEMDTEKNQYETAQTGSPAEEQAKKVSDALEKLDALAKRQEELAQQQGNQAQNFQQRWQQEMLRREAEQLQREMEQMQQSQQAAAGQNASGGKGSQGQQSQSQQGQNQQSQNQQSQNQQGQNQQSQSQQSQSPGQQGQGQSASGGGSSSGGGQSGNQSGGQSGDSQSAGSQSASRSESQSGSNPRDGGTDPRVQQALDRLRNANEAMRRATGQSQTASRQNGQQSGNQQNGQQQAGQQAGQRGSEQALRAAEQLREATNLLGGAQHQQTSSKLDSLRQESDRLTTEESSQAARIKSLAESAANGGSAADRTRDLNKLVDDRQRMSDDLAHLQKGMRDTARELASTQPKAASKVRDALGIMDESDLGNRVQRTSDWLRRGINPNSNGNEAAIASDLKQLSESLRQAQQGMGAPRDAQGKRGQAQGNETAELDHIDRLRNQIQSMQQQLQRGQQGQGSQPGQGNRNQSGRPGQQGQGQQSQGQSSQSGNQQSGSQSGSQQSGGRQSGAGQQPGGQPGIGGGDRQYADSGDVGNNRIRGGGGGIANYNVDTGDSGFDRNAKHVQDGPHNTSSAADSERTINQGLQELSKLRQLTQGDPAAAREVQDLVKEMQQLDPNRFPGNPAMVEQLHTRVLQDIDKLELQLRRNADDPAITQVRTSQAPTVPPGYQDAVAEYYRRLGKTN